MFIQEPIPKARSLFRMASNLLFLSVRNKLWFGLFQIFLFEIEPERFELFSKRVQRFVSDLVRRMLKRCPSLGPGLNFKIEDFFLTVEDFCRRHQVTFFPPEPASFLFPHLPSAELFQIVLVS